jgi:hypothetical protein
MKRDRDAEFFDQLKKEIDAERNVDYGARSADEDARIANYPKDTPPGYAGIKAADFFDGD